MNQNQPAKIDCVVRVVTPENIEFEYMLAGPFQRLPAFLVDFALRTTIFAALVMLTLFIGVPIIGSMGFALVITVGSLAFFVLSWLYGTIMEAQFNGRTVGKVVFGLRTISSDGRPINASQAALRNLLRLCDFMPPLSLTLLVPSAPPVDLLPTCFIGLAAMTLTTRMQRVGDLAANTMVVWEGRRGHNVNLQPEDPRAYALAELIPPTIQFNRTLARAVALYMERRLFLAGARREEIAHNLAEPLLRQFELQPDTSADLLLCAIYVRMYHSQEHRDLQLASARRGRVGTTQMLTNQNKRPLTLAEAQQAAMSAGPHAVPGTATSGDTATSAALASASRATNNREPLTGPSRELSSQVLTAEIIAAEVLNSVPALPVVTAETVEQRNTTAPREDHQ